MAGGQGHAGVGRDQAQARFQNAILAASRPVRSAYYQRLAQMLGTGTPGDIFQVQHALEGNAAAGSTARQKALGQLAAADLSRTPQGIRQLGAAEAGGNLATALTPSDVGYQYIQAAPSAAIGQPQQQVLAGNYGLGRLEAENYIRNLYTQTENYAQIGQALGSLAGHYMNSGQNAMAMSGGGGGGPAGLQWT